MTPWLTLSNLKEYLTGPKPASFYTKHFLEVESIFGSLKVLNSFQKYLKISQILKSDCSFYKMETAKVHFIWIWFIHIYVHISENGLKIMVYSNNKI